jgi:hypothetical protein
VLLCPKVGLAQHGAVHRLPPFLSHVARHP